MSSVFGPLKLGIRRWRSRTDAFVLESVSSTMERVLFVALSIRGGLGPDARYQDVLLSLIISTNTRKPLPPCPYLQNVFETSKVPATEAPQAHSIPDASFLDLRLSAIENEIRNDIALAMNTWHAGNFSRPLPSELTISLALTLARMQATTERTSSNVKALVSYIRGMQEKQHRELRRLNDKVTRSAVSMRRHHIQSRCFEYEKGPSCSNDGTDARSTPRN
jgi:hypothetical protein